jgi:hypothetical protein
MRILVLVAVAVVMVEKSCKLCNPGTLSGKGKGQSGDPLSIEALLPLSSMIGLLSQQISRLTSKYRLRQAPA